jgi:hypothetical protein
MIASTNNPLIDKWSGRFARRRHSNEPRPLAALGYLTHGVAADGFIELSKFVLVLLFDAPANKGASWLRVCGVGGQPIPWGIYWGGRQRNKFLKNLSLKPLIGAGGRRIDADDVGLLQLSLALDHELDRRMRNRCLPVQKSVRLPKVWAGFRPGECRNITGGGPELADHSRRKGRSMSVLLRDARRDHCGCALFPLEWVSHHWKEAVTYFVDLRRFPKRQVFLLNGSPRDAFCGYQGAMQFDFLANRFDRRRHDGRRYFSNCR